MKELIKLIIRLDFQSLFITPTDNSYIKFFRYVFVGGIAFIIDWLTLYILKHYIHYLLAVAIAFIFGLVVNFILSKKVVFTEKAVVKKVESEFTLYCIIGLIGLGLTELLVYILTDWVKLYIMLSKTIAAIIVLIWNFFARKYLIYHNNMEGHK